MPLKLLACISMLMITSLQVFASSEDVFQVATIVERHIQALGGRDKINHVTATITRGEYREGKFVAPGVYIARMRPYYRTICDPSQPPGEVCEGYDGSAWEYYKDPGIVLRTVGAAAAATRHGLDLLDSLVDYESNGTTVELVGDELFHGHPAYRMHVTLADGFEKDMFVDKESFLVIGDRRRAPVHAFGDAVLSENEIGDYRTVDGILFPFLYKEVAIATGAEMNRLTIQSVTVNPKLSPESFSPPQFARTSYQRFLEQLYMERTDPIAVRWTYREFRAAHPEADTREGVEFIGYQMIKMLDFNGAIVLLQANALDNPHSASAQYGLGRAYKAVGDSKNARTSFQKALELDPGFKKATQGLEALR